MSVFFKFVLIPGWLEQALESRGLPKETLLDFVKLESILSKQDISFYIEINERLLDKTYPYLFNNGFNFPYKQLSKETKDVLYRHGNAISSYGDAPNQYLPLTKMLSYSQVEAIDKNETSDPLNINNYLFEPFLINNNVIGIRPLLARKDEDLMYQKKVCLDALLNIVNAYSEPDTYTQTLFFKHYMQTLVWLNQQAA